MSIKPVLVPDHTANDLRRLMDHFAEASSGPTKQQLTESRAAVAAAPGVAEAAKWRTHPDAHDHDTDGSPMPKGGIKSDPLSIRQGVSRTQSEKDPKSLAGKFGDKYAKKHGVPTKQLMKNIPLDDIDEQGVAEGKRADRYHIVKKDGKPATLASYADRDSAAKDRDEKYPGATVQKVGPRGKVKDVTEGSDDSGAYDKWDPKHPDFVKNYRKFQAKNPGATLKDYIADLKKGVTEGQGMSRAAKGYEKYGQEGMQALAKAGREGRALDPVRDRYDRYDEAVAEGQAGKELKAIDGDYYEDSTDFFSMFEQDHFDREEESEDGMEIRGYIDDVCVMVFKFSTPDMMGGWGNYDDSALMAESGVEDEEGDVCPECDGAGCPECYGDEDRDRAHDHAQGMERESAGMAEGGRPDVMRHRGDTTVKVVKRAGKPIGEIGIDAEASPGNGQYYVKLYDGSYDAVGFDTAAEALAELKAAISEGITETAAVKYGVFAKGGSVGSQRFRDDPLKTFDTKEEATADARRRRSGLSKGERGYYRMGYVVKPIKGSAQQVDEIDMGLVGDAVAGAAMGLGSVGLGSYIGHKIGNKIGQKFIDRSNRKEAERQAKYDREEWRSHRSEIDEKSEAVRHGNNNPSIYHVDESVDPIEQLRADIRRFAQ